ncbi:RagB/SusD family nutrient uptake outer membrane protein [Chitinophaga eiseniae]|uniref:RagB/SusD family nutrient uptake outer membrane protein n=1 Tax=Chitinophaga eiseniae TaxID=634771 RepID=A0A847SJ03_9BACT|nr:RagB/SusD family nutrient uptake outer membrane protein [Chitinophaga eiseniae]NLR77378.1 RagB/SusD family nutrient uptake outer membrane protein [Chitinophaga eiseniae]
MQKRKYSKQIYILAACLLLGITACKKDFLVRDNPTATTDPKWWNLEIDLQNALEQIYGGLPCGTLGDYEYISNSRIHLSGTTDEAVFRGNYGDWQVYPVGLATSQTGSVQAIYQKSYSYIRNASRFLENYRKAYVEDTARKARYAAEARALRAWYHLDLFLLYGPIPIVNQSLLPAGQFVKRNSREEVVNFLVAELDTAAASLPATYTESDAYRMSKGTCYALQTILYINVGDYTKCIAAARKLIALNAYELYHSSDPAINSYSGLFSYSGIINKERILFRRGAQTESFFRNAPKSLGGQATTNPTAAIVNTYETLQGKTLSELGADSMAIYKRQPEYKQNRDPRLAASVMVPGETFVNRKLDPFTPGGPDLIGQTQSTQTGYWIKKYVDPRDAGTPWAGSLNFMIIRYAEILLDYVEALVETGDWQNPDVVKYLNMIRNRAGMPNVDINQYNTQAKMRELIRRERQVELAFEGQRLYDIRRWKTAEIVLNQAAEGAVDPSTGKAVVVEQRKFNPARDYVWPIPLVEINANPNMQQNPNW